MSPPVRRAARALTAASLSATDRVLVTGAGGWFGSTVAALLHGSGVPTMYVTRRPRAVGFGSGQVEAVAWDVEAVARFAPTVVIDCAFVLRDHIDSMSLERYVYANTVLTARLLQVMQLPCLRAVVSVSSGAAVHPDDACLRGVDADPYGYLKRQTELAVLAAGDATGVRVVVARPWSLSGSLVTRPTRYAFSDLIVQARSGEIRIAAAHEVWRRYAGVDDFFAVALSMAARASGVLDSGGELVEVGALAERVCRVLDVQADIRRPASGDAPADAYHLRTDGWEAACATAGLRPADLDEQIVAVDAYLRVAAV